MTEYFTEREYGVRPPEVEVINERVWDGLRTLIETRISDGSFGYMFPKQCPDDRGPYGCDKRAFRTVLLAEVPWIEEWPLAQSDLPETPVIFDIIEFCARSVGKPEEGSYHRYLEHYHLSWNRAAGLVSFVEDVNRLFRRNAIAFEISHEGLIQRKLPSPISDIVTWNTFRTGDEETDSLLQAAVSKFLSRQKEDHQDALEKLWDAFERVKTLEEGNGKRLKAEALLNRTASSGTAFRNTLGDEARALTSIGNSFRIRHSEVDQEKISEPDHADYLFVRMFAFLRLVLRRSGRGG